LVPLDGKLFLRYFLVLILGLHDYSQIFNVHFLLSATKKYQKVDEQTEGLQRIRTIAVSYEKGKRNFPLRAMAQGASDVPHTAVYEVQLGQVSFRVLGILLTVSFYHCC
jgi:hypothetical protein